MKGNLNLPHTSKLIASTSALTTRNESHVISNFKPKIRIIHILAPEIIKTDPANFRQLVQRLTGKKPAGMKDENKVAKKTIEALESNYCKAKETPESWNSGSTERVKEEEEEEEEMRGEENWNSFGGLGDLDGLIQGLINDFPLVQSSYSCMDSFGESN